MEKTAISIDKYRAWDKQDKRMIVHEQDFIPVKVTSMGVLSLNPYNEDNLWEFMPEDRFVLMRSAGLKDKNGVELFAGDAIYGVEYEDGQVRLAGKYVIKWNPETYCLVGYGDGEWLMLEEFEGTELIGNIYANPELNTTP